MVEYINKGFLRRSRPRPWAARAGRGPADQCHDDDVARRCRGCCRRRLARSGPPPPAGRCGSRCLWARPIGRPGPMTQIGSDRASPPSETRIMMPPSHWQSRTRRDSEIELTAVALPDCRGTVSRRLAGRRTWAEVARLPARGVPGRVRAAHCQWQAVTPGSARVVTPACTATVTQAMT